MGGDVEINPGDTFDFMQWNCNSLVAHQYSRIPLIEAYSSLHKLQIIALCKTALKPEHNNTDIEIDGYSIIRNDLPVGDSHGGVMIYHKNDLAVKHRIDIQSLSNTIVLELSISKKKVFFILAYRKFGQSNDECINFEHKIDEMIVKLKLENPHCIILAGDFNAHLKEWYEGDENDNVGISLQRIFSKHLISKMTNQPTYITKNARTCIDLMCTDQPNIVLRNEVHPSLHTNCHHQVIFTKNGNKLSSTTPHTRHIWHYSRAKTDLIKKVSIEYNWEAALATLNPDEQIQHFNDVIMNISKKIIPNEAKTYKPKEPPWLTSSCKAVYSKYKRKFKIFSQNNFPADQKQKIDELKENYTQMVTNEKEKYLSNLGNKLSDPQTGPKKYWNILKKILKKI